jgi:polyphosphate glucokinase
VNGDPEVIPAFGIDIGGSGVKAAVVDLASGTLLGERFRIPTPQPAKPAAVMDAAAQIAANAGWGGRPIGCTVPAVVRDGIVYSAANIHTSWVGADGEGLLAQRTGCPVHLLNDADAAGIGELRYGAAADAAEQVVIVLTFGTGIGSAMFVDGRLWRNSELGHLELDGYDAETRAAARLREDGNLSWAKWIERVQRYLTHLELVLSPDLIVFGGGISKKSEKFLPKLKTRARLVPATLRNNAGIVGAAAAARDRFGEASIRERS